MVDVYNVVSRGVEDMYSTLKPSRFCNGYGGRRHHDRMVVGFTATCAISVYHH